MAGIVFGCQLLHLYLMVGPSKKWAGGSILLLTLSAIHLAGAYNAFMVIFKNATYFHEYHCLRTFFLIVSIVELCLFVLGLFYEMYLIYFTDDFVNMAMTAYLGYVLIISLSALPQIIFTIFAETTHALDPTNKTQTTPSLLSTTIDEESLIFCKSERK